MIDGWARAEALPTNRPRVGDKPALDVVRGVVPGAEGPVKHESGFTRPSHSVRVPMCRGSRRQPPEALSLGTRREGPPFDASFPPERSANALSP